MSLKVAVIKICSLLLCALAVTACTDGMTAALLREYNDPFVEIPKVVSFELENTIYVSWSLDLGADEYILQRADDSDTPVYQTIYRGTALRYTDSGLPGNKLYLYRLAKTRGDKTFEASRAAFGVSAKVRKDVYENNDSEFNATLLEEDRIANLNYFKSYAGDELIDADWYYVVVPPHREANLFVTEAAGDLDLGAATHYMFLCKTDTTVTNGNQIVLDNPLDTTEIIRFKIHPNPDHFTLTGGAGGETVTYTVTLDSIVQEQ